MKPIKLTIQAFESYKGVTMIDFTRFSNSLFLIEGKTGAGKTTIFDAISYALYGEPSGDVRVAKNLRSDYADDDLKTRITLDFLVHGKSYSVWREPPQLCPKKKGKFDEAGNKQFKYVSESVEFSGFMIDKPLTGKDANKAIVALLGLEKEQFSKTMMIAQEEFMGLINASTENRRLIFQKILGTKPFEDFENNLAMRAKDMATDLVKDNGTIDTIISSYPTESETLLSLILTKGNNVPHLSLETSLPLIEEDIKNSSKEIGDNKLIIDEKKKEAEASAKAASFGAVNNSNIDKYLRNTSLLSSLKEKEEGFSQEKKRNELYAGALIAEANFRGFNENESKEAKERENNEKISKSLPLLERTKDDSIKAKDEIPSLSALRDAATAKKKSFEDILGLFLDKKTKEAEESSAVRGLNNSKENLKKKEDELKEKENTLAGLRKISDNSSLSADIEKNKSSISEIDKSIDEAKRLLLINGSLLMDKANKDKFDEDFVKESKSFDEQKERYEAQERIFFASQAGIMASRLLPDTPCPVCGSLSHPSPHKLEGEVSEKGLKDSKNKLEEKRLKKDEAFEKAKVSFAGIKEKEASLLDDCSRLIGEKVAIDNVLISLSSFKDRKLNEKKTLQDSLSKMLLDLGEENKRKDTIASLDKEIATAIKPEIKKLRTSLGAAQTRYDKVEESLKDLKNRLGDNTIDSVKESIALEEKNSISADTKITSISNDASRADNKYKLAIEAKKSSDNNLASYSSSKESFKASLDASLSQYGFTSYEDAKALLIIPKAEISESKKTVEDFYSSLDAARALEKSYLDEGYDKLLKQDLESLDAKKKIDAEGYETLVKENQARIDALNSKKDILRRVNEVVTSSGPKRVLANKMRHLSDAANGNLNQSEGLDFETYYQSQIFSSIVEIASKKFSRMSGGTLLMYVHKRNETDKKGTPTALDIDIFDTSTGKLRALSTLSGGECFKAALALSLSFSEVIRNEAGATELDCMFIDEGFGTLDEDSLHDVMSLLRELSQSSSRMIGVISHVEELSDAIHQKILVTKDDEGSHIKIIAGGEA